MPRSVSGATERKPRPRAEVTSESALNASLYLRLRLLDAGGAALQTKVLENLAIAKSGSGRLHLYRAAAHAAASLRSARPELKRLTVVVIAGAAANSSATTRW
ncbi:MAG: hypothetical protein AB1582_10505 [Pseudomonadota bacterium]